MVKQLIKKCKYRFSLPENEQECIGLECHHYQQLRGNHPQTGQPVDEYMCTDEWSNILLIENSQMQRQTGAAVESLRNGIVKTLPKVIN